MCNFKITETILFLLKILNITPFFTNNILSTVFLARQVVSIMFQMKLLF